MDMKMIDITLEYLMRQKYYHKYQNKDEEKKQEYISIRNKDKKFYKKRINDMTRYFMKYDQEEDKNRYYPEQLESSFYEYINTAIEYFKMIDKTDIIQEDYIGLSLLEDEDDDDAGVKEKDEEKMPPIETYKSFMFPQNTPLLGNFIKVTKKTLEPTNYPHQKEICLEDPKLKTKGIVYHDIHSDGKNNNIINNYEKQTK